MDLLKPRTGNTPLQEEPGVKVVLFAYQDSPPRSQGIPFGYPISPYIMLLPLLIASKLPS